MPAIPDMALEPGTRLGTYEVIAPIGSGGMGDVYRAHDTNLRRDVAIKLLPHGRSAAELTPARPTANSRRWIR